MGLENNNRLEEVTTVGEVKQTNIRRMYISGLISGLIISALILGLVYIGKNLVYLVQVNRAQTSADVDDAQSISDGTAINAETLSKMKTLENVINEYYYLYNKDKVTTKDIQDGIYKGIISALEDPYSEYYTKEELEDAMSGFQGISYGIGAYISLNKQKDIAMISGVMEGTPAEEAGLRDGDIIYKVGDEFTQGMSISKVVSLVKGQENTMVNLTIYREGEPDYLEFNIVRGKQIEIDTVDSGMLNDTNQVGYIKIYEFDEVTVDQFTEALAVLKGSGMKGLLLDLRSNPGGDLDTVIEIARKILPEGLIVYTEDKTGNRSEYTCDGTTELQVPLVVLINEYSASASEILAEAIKDYNKGTLIGTTTYGKGIVQRIHRLEDGTAVKLTVSSYFPPSGKDIQGVGVEPDIELQFDADAYYNNGVDNQMEKAIEVLEGKIIN